MARAMKRGSEAYFSRNSTAHSTTKPPVISASAASGSAPGAPEAASISCCMSHVTIRFSVPPASAANTASAKTPRFPR